MSEALFNQIEEDIDPKSIEFIYLFDGETDKLRSLRTGNFDVCVLFAGIREWEHPFRFSKEEHQPYLDHVNGLLNQIENVISPIGTLYIYGSPQWLPYFAVHLDKRGWGFKYWIALEVAHPPQSDAPLIDTHQGILLYVRNKKKFSLRKVRSPHQNCDVCGDFTADWGGKSHLRHPMGYAISDVWDDLPSALDNDHVLSQEVWQRLLLLTATQGSRVLCVAYDGKRDLDEFILG